MPLNKEAKSPFRHKITVKINQSSYIKNNHPYFQNCNFKLLIDEEAFKSSQQL